MRGGGLGFPFPTILLRGGSNSPHLDVQCVKFGFPVLPFIFPRGHFAKHPAEHLGYGWTRRAFGKWRRTPNLLRLAEPFLAADGFQNNVMLNINKVFGFWVTYLGVWVVAA